MGATGLAVLAAGTIAALAPPAQTDDLAEDAPDRLRLGVEMRVLYDDNILRLDEGRAAPPDRSRDDVRTTLSAVADVAQRVSRQRLFLRGAAGYDFYARNHFLRRERIDATGGVDWRVGSRCDGEASLGYGRGQTDLEDLGALVRNTRDSRTLLLDGGCTIGVGWRPEVGYRHRRIDNSAPVRQRSDLTAERVSAGLSYGRSERLRIALAVASETLDFPHRPLGDGRHDATRLGSVVARLTWRGGGLIADGTLGYADADSRGARTRDFAGLVGGAALAWSSGGRLRLTVDVRRALDASGDVAAGYFVADRGEAAARYRIGRAVDVEFAGLVERRRFRAVDAASVGARSFDRSVELRAGLGWSPVDRARIGVEAVHARRTTDAAFGTYRSTRGQLVLGLAF